MSRRTLGALSVLVAATMVVSLSLSLLRECGVAGEVAAEQEPRVYIVDEVINASDRACTPGYVYYDSTTPLLVNALRTHRCRVMDPEEATLFVVPFDTRGSYAAQRCNGRWHSARMIEVYDRLRRWPLFKRNGGRDFFWDLMYWQTFHADLRYRDFLAEPLYRSTVLRNMVVGSFLRFHRKRPLVYPGEPVLRMPKDHLQMNGALCVSMTLALLLTPHRD